MPTSRNITRIEVDWDEDACMLMLEFEGDGYVNWYTLDGVDLDAFYDQVKGRIGPYLQEKEAAFAEFKQAAKYGTGPAAAFVCSRYDVDESGGYDRSDPKHPDWHSVHADHYDEQC